MMLGKWPRKALCISGLFALTSASAWANCRSATSSPEWPYVVRSVAEAQLCEQLPVGPNRTRSLKVLSADLCSDGDGISTVRATALLTCESDPDSFFQTPPLEGDVVAVVSLDAGACRIMDSRIEIGGDIGSLLSGLQDTQEFARNWAQSQLSRLCQLR